MKQAIWKNGPFIMVGLAMVLSFYALKRIMTTPEVVRSPENFSYEMPRPKSVEVGYDLSGRQVVRNIRSLPPKVKPALAKPVVSNKPTTPAVDPKKAQAEAKRKAEEARKKALAQRKAQMSVPVAQAKAPTMNGFESAKPVAAPAVAAAAVAPASVPAEVIPEDPKKKTRKSVEEWRSLLYSQPTPKNGTDFAKAYHSNEVEAVAFYRISEELMKDSSVQRQQLGVWILKQDTSVRTFTVLATHAGENTPEPMKSEIDRTLKTYGEQANFSILNSVLTSPNPRAAAMGRKILAEALNNHQSGGAPSPTGRDARGYGLNAVAPARFEIFIRTLEQLANNDDPSIALDAQRLLDSIKALKTSSV